MENINKHVLMNIDGNVENNLTCLSRNVGEAFENGVENEISRGNGGFSPKYLALAHFPRPTHNSFLPLERSQKEPTSLSILSRR